MVKAVVLVKSPKKLIAVKLKQINSVYESFPVSGQFDAVAVIKVENLSEIKDRLKKQNIPLRILN